MDAPRTSDSEIMPQNTTNINIFLLAIISVYGKFSEVSYNMGTGDLVLRAVRGVG